jgi:hypothetical protein
VAVRAAIVRAVTVTYAAGEQPQQHPLAPGASPSHIRGALLPEDRQAFDTAYAQALDTARETLELTALCSRRLSGGGASRRCRLTGTTSGEWPDG